VADVDRNRTYVDVLERVLGSSHLSDRIEQSAGGGGVLTMWRVPGGIVTALQVEIIDRHAQLAT
jgi:hypothetical protein